jgi:hypothetical protein
VDRCIEAFIRIALERMEPARGRLKALRADFAANQTERHRVLAAILALGAAGHNAACDRMQALEARGRALQTSVAEEEAKLGADGGQSLPLPAIHPVLRDFDELSRHFTPGERRELLHELVGEVRVYPGRPGGIRAVDGEVHAPQGGRVPTSRNNKATAATVKCAWRVAWLLGLCSGPVAHLSARSPVKGPRRHTRIVTDAVATDDGEIEGGELLLALGGLDPEGAAGDLDRLRVEVDAVEVSLQDGAVEVEEVALELPQDVELAGPCPECWRAAGAGLRRRR